MEAATVGGFDGADGFMTRLARTPGAFTGCSGAGLRVRGRGAFFVGGAGGPSGGRDWADAAGAMDDSRRPLWVLASFDVLGSRRRVPHFRQCFAGYGWLCIDGRC